MAYCINPNCLCRENLDDQGICVTCGTSLLIQGRYTIIEPILCGKHSRHFEVFEVKDSLAHRKVLKVLKTDHPNLITLFYREAQVLSWLNSPGIPAVEPDGYFPFPSKDEPILHCLVMEKVEGQALDQWLQDNPSLSPETTLIWLKELTQILDFVHRHHLFHGDIKPSNIIRKPNGRLALIDFGAVQQSLYTVEESALLLTAGYAAPEQLDRQAVPQSDFYALGRTFVQLLTGQHPLDLEEKEGTLMWRQFLPASFPGRLADLIDELMQYRISDRPKNTADIQKRLELIFHDSVLQSSAPGSDKSYASVLTPWDNSKTMKVILTVLLIFSIGSWFKLRVPSLKSQTNPNVTVTTGEATLMAGEVSPEKQQGMDAMAREEYDTAIKYLKDSLDDSKSTSNPETRIFLNNARIGVQKSYAIAVFVPVTCPFNRSNSKKSIGSGSVNAALEIMTGVANAQEEINRQRNTPPLKIALACGHNQDDATMAAREILKRSDILGIVGPPARDATQAAEKLYCKTIVSISPGSSSDALNNCDQFVFRMLPHDALIAATLSQHLLTVQKRQKAVIFFNSKNTLSQSLNNEFIKSLTAHGGHVLEQFDLAKPKFNAANAVESALFKKAEVLVFFADGYILDRALDVINANRRRLLLLAGGHMFALKTLAKTQQNGLGMVVTAPCQDEAKNLPWRNVLAYESVYAFNAALKIAPTRMGIRTALISEKFKSKGVCAPVQFLPSGDRNTIVPLMQIFPGRNSGFGYDFVRLPKLLQLNADALWSDQAVPRQKAELKAVEKGTVVGTASFYPKMDTFMVDDTNQDGRRAFVEYRIPAANYRGVCEDTDGATSPLQSCYLNFPKNLAINWRLCVRDADGPKPTICTTSREDQT